MRVGIDMGGMSIKIGLVNEHNTIIDKASIPTELDIPYPSLLLKLSDCVKQLLKKNGVSLQECDGIGIGSPGTVDEKNGEILYSNNFGWESIPIAAELKKNLNTRIELANDADAAAFGEVCAGAAKGTKNAVLLTLGTGVGGGVILDGHIFHGRLAGGCELGHMVIVCDGEECSCGRRGCLEAYASASALMRMAIKAANEHPESMLFQMYTINNNQMNGKIPFDAALAGDKTGQQVVQIYESYLACGIANIINIFRPEKVILGGGVAAQKENLTKPLQRLVNQLCFGGKHAQIPEIVVSELGNDAGIIGAANLLR